MKFDTKAFHSLLRKIRPILSGHKPEVRSAVLSVLVAEYIGRQKDDKNREELLQEHIMEVRALALCEVVHCLTEAKQ